MSEAFTVLLAEDEGAVAASVAAQLAGLGHRVLAEAVTGSEAVALAISLKPQVIIMDIVMPDCDGIEAARKISQDCPTPVVFLSGHFDQALLQGVTEAGGLAYLLKPATPDQLQAALTLAVRQFREIQDMQEQLTRLDQALEDRKVLAKAKGLIMAQHGITEQETHRWLQKQASRSNVALIELARAIVAASPVLTHRSPK
jgi:response regulator NasT